MRYMHVVPAKMPFANFNELSSKKSYIEMIQVFIRVVAVISKTAKDH